MVIQEERKDIFGNDRVIEFILLYLLYFSYNMDKQDMLYDIVGAQSVLIGFPGQVVLPPPQTLTLSPLLILSPPLRLLPLLSG